MIVPFFGPKQSLSDNAIDRSLYLPCKQHKNQKGVACGSPFEQTMMSWSPQCYIPSFVEIGPTVPEKKIFEGFLSYMGVAAILVM